MASTHFTKTITIGAETKSVGGVVNPTGETKAVPGITKNGIGADTKSNPSLANVSGEVGHLSKIDSTLFSSVSNSGKEHEPTQEQDNSHG